ncbi:kallikrein-7-like [Myotis myotis]|uniref:kallikrein-7-like n=1 Tax=Myotis myotis TaxID=51298 RepID=UPI00174B773D|nr:kallikrein-7-like [Myotis myotis]
MRVEVECGHMGLAASGFQIRANAGLGTIESQPRLKTRPDQTPCSPSTEGPSSVAATEAQRGHMAGPLLQPLLLLLLSFALGSAEKEGLHHDQDTGERIINGVPCSIGSHPWQVALYDNDELHCAGVLVHQQWVLTVAHCRLSEYIVQMGSDLLVDGNAQRIRATESFIHPWYINGTYYHDIMLVKLRSPATLSPTVSTIDLPSSCKGRGTSCTVSGWGVTTADAGANREGGA